MFETDASWEDIKRGQMMSAMCGKPKHCYPFFEVPVNSCIFHVDILFKELSDFKAWTRFIVYDLLSVLQLTAPDDDVAELRVSLQTPLQRDGKYVISLITEIIEGKNSAGNRRYICKCSNMKSYPGSITSERESDLSEKRTVWPLL